MVGYHTQYREQGSIVIDIFNSREDLATTSYFSFIFQESLALSLIHCTILFFFLSAPSSGDVLLRCSGKATDQLIISTPPQILS
jgi:hypothetical protein